MKSVYFGVLLGQLILFGIVYMIENKLNEEDKIVSFWKRRWRSMAFAFLVFIHIINLAFMHGSGLLYI